MTTPHRPLPLLFLAVAACSSSPRDATEACEQLAKKSLVAGCAEADMRGLLKAAASSARAFDVAGSKGQILVYPDTERFTKARELFRTFSGISKKHLIENERSRLLVELPAETPAETVSAIKEVVASW